MQEMSTANLRRKLNADLCPIENCMAEGTKTCTKKGCATNRRRCCANHGGKHEKHATLPMKPVPDTAVAAADEIDDSSHSEGSDSSEHEMDIDAQLSADICFIMECNDNAVGRCEECNIFVCSLHGPSHLQHVSQLRKDRD